MSLARGLFNSFLRQIFGVGVFHADPHPGNVLLLPGGSLALLDFGSVGRLDRFQQTALAQALLAINRSHAPLLALPAKAATLDGINITQVLGYAGLAAATLLGLRVVAAVGRHRN